MQTRVEVTKKYTLQYDQTSKKQKSQILDTVVEITDWNPDHARQQLSRHVRQTKSRAEPTGAVLDRRISKAHKDSYDAIKMLQHVWSVWLSPISNVQAAPDLAGLSDSSINEVTPQHDSLRNSDYLRYIQDQQ